MSRLLKAFYIDGESSADYGLFITGAGVYDAPAYDYEAVQIPGRSGDLLLDNGRFFNLSVTYPAFVPDVRRLQAIRQWLFSKRGYCRLCDDYNPDEYRMAAYASGLSVDVFANRAGSFDLVFNCKPQRFLFEGLRAQKYVSIFTDGNHFYTSNLSFMWPLAPDGTEEAKLIQRNTSAGTMFSTLYGITDYNNNLISNAQLSSYMTYQGGGVAELDLGAAGYLSGGMHYLQLIFTAEDFGSFVFKMREYDAFPFDVWNVSGVIKLNNPGPFNARPLLEFEAHSGYDISQPPPVPPAITINGIAVELSNYTGRLFVDCDLCDAYLYDENNDYENGNPYITLYDNAELTTEFPQLYPGENTISLLSNTEILTGSDVGESAISFTPRWWII